MNVNHDSDEKIQSMLTAIKGQTPSQQHDDAMQIRLDTAIADYQGPVAEPADSPSKLAGLWSWLSGLGFKPQLGMAGAAAVTLTVSLFMLTSVSTPAFAAVVKKLTDITSMVYSGQMQSNGNPVMTIEVFYQAPGKIRVVNTPMPDVTQQPSVINVMDTELGKGLILFPQRKAAMPLDFAPGKDAKSAIENKLFDWHSQILNYQGEVIVNADAQVINGIATTSFTLTPENMEIVLWVDPDTELPVRVRVATSAAEQASFVFSADVRFNQMMDPELFDVSPADYYIMGSGED